MFKTQFIEIHKHHKTHNKYCAFYDFALQRISINPENYLDLIPKKKLFNFNKNLRNIITDKAENFKMLIFHYFKIKENIDSKEEKTEEEKTEEKETEEKENNSIYKIIEQENENFLENRYPKLRNRFFFSPSLKKNINKKNYFFDLFLINLEVYLDHGFLKRPILNLKRTYYILKKDAFIHLFRKTISDFFLIFDKNYIKIKNFNIIENSFKNYIKLYYIKIYRTKFYRKKFKLIKNFFEIKKKIEKEKEFFFRKKPYLSNLKDQKLFWKLYVQD